MKVLIVDDEPLARSELNFLLKDNPFVDHVSEAEGVFDTKQKLMKERPDLIFLDIKLDDGDGMEFAKTLKDGENKPYIVFATAYDQYALEAFDAQAVDYILKPFEKARIDETIRRVNGILEKQADVVLRKDAYKNPRLSITVDERTMVLQKKNILYLEAQRGSVLIYTKNLPPISSKQTLINLERQLNPEQFLRVHRSFVVNLDSILEFQPSFNHTYELILINQAKITVSRSYVASTKRALGIR